MVMKRDIDGIGGVENDAVIYEKLAKENWDQQAKIARLESSGIEDMKYRIKILESALRDVDMLIQNGQIAHARDAIKRALEAATP